LFSDRARADRFYEADTGRLEAVEHDRTAMEPSPKAVATRLTDRLRTSPTQKSPGRLVSSSSGMCSTLSS
jgi:hypothetical protein